jgi:hypothetical protein
VIFHIATLLILFALTLAPQIAGRLQKLEEKKAKENVLNKKMQTNRSITEERVDWVILNCFRFVYI